MSVYLIRELACDCRAPTCPHSQPLEGRCVGAMADYASTESEIRGIARRREGWTAARGEGSRSRKIRDFCPTCSAHRAAKDR